MTMRGIIFMAVMALLIGAFVPKMYNVEKPKPAQAMALQVEPPPVNNNSRSVTLREQNGHYFTQASVDGRRLDFMVDTGASTIALRESDAARLGIHPSERDYKYSVSTANGVVRAAGAELNRVDVGGVTVRNVRALILPDRALSGNLLGMTFLGKVRWEQKNGKLTLEQ
jgi:aspartyl protease family protein